MNEKGLMEISVIRKLSQLQPWKCLCTIILEWLVCILFFTLFVETQNPFVYVLCWFVIGTRQYGLYSILHDALHFHILPNRKLNDQIARVFLAWPLFISLTDMRREHFEHHKNLLTDKDPEMSNLKYKEFQFPKTKQELIFILLKDITGINFIYYKYLKWVGFIRNPAIIFKQSKHFLAENIQAILYYCFITSVLMYFNLFLFFVLLYIIPYITIYQVLNRLRFYTEHRNLDHESAFKTRSLKLDYVQEYFFSPHNLGYHTEHHLYPSVPFYHLPKLHQELSKKSEFSGNMIMEDNYFSIFKLFVK